MAKKPRKPTRFPRKFRQKLEKMRADRGDDPGPGPTLAMDFLGNKSVKLMHTVLDDSSADPREWKLRIRHTLNTNRSRMARTIKTVELLPPWDIDETPASA
jgi:hypothetical protein